MESSQSCSFSVPYKNDFQTYQFLRSFVNGELSTIARTELVEVSLRGAKNYLASMDAMVSDFNFLE